MVKVGKDYSMKLSQSINITKIFVESIH